MATILVIDESSSVRETLHLLLSGDHRVLTFSSWTEAKPNLEKGEGDLLVVGSELLMDRLAAESVAKLPPLLFLIDSIPAFPPGILNARNVDFLRKPFHPLALKEKIQASLTRGASRKLQEGREKPNWQKYLQYPYLPQQTSLLVSHILQAEFPVHLQGENGTGKGRVARALHCARHEDTPFVRIGARALNRQTVFQSMANIHRKVFPPAAMTLCVEEVEKLPHEGQVLLLDILEEGGYITSHGKVAVWVLSATSGDLFARTRSGKFLTDLYYKLTVFSLHLPSLRTRLQDIPALAGLLAEEISRRLRLGSVEFSSEAIHQLQNYLWFGNISELEAVLARTLAVRRKNMVEKEDLLFSFAAPVAAHPPTPPATAQIRLPGNLRIILGQLAHELKNPMVTLKTFSHYLDRTAEDVEFREKFAALTGEAIERMDGMLENLLEFSRFADSTTLTPVRLAQLLRQLFGEKQLQVVVDEEGNGTSLALQEEQVRYVFGSLLDVIVSDISPVPAMKVSIAEGRRVIFLCAASSATVQTFRQLAHFREEPAVDFSPLPLKLLLAKILLERNGGILEIDDQVGNALRLIIRFSGKAVALQ